MLKQIARGLLFASLLAGTAKADEVDASSVLCWHLPWLCR